jgi:branched-chain amino acid transport system ATP-binding protein
VADPATPLLQARGVKVCYESVEVLHGVDLRIDQGSVTAVLGPNGAGKSTLLSVLAGLNQPSAGEVTFDGKPVRAGTGHSLVRAGLCLVPEGKGIFPNLSVQENLWMMTHRGTSRRQVEERAFDRFPQLSSRRSQAAGTLSGGEQQMLALARAVSTEPRLLMLDELSMGLAPIVVENLYDVVGALARDGVTVVVVEQFAQFALKVAEWAVVMTGGRVVHAGPAADVSAHLAELYLSGQADNGNVPDPAAPGGPAVGR